MSMYYFKSTIRNARKNGVLSFAKLFGITISLAVMFFAAGYVFYETSFDRFIPDQDRIFRCMMIGKTNGNDADFAVTNWAMGEATVHDIAEVTEAVKLIGRGEAYITYETQLFEGVPLLYTDTNFFSFFGFPVVNTLEQPFEQENHLSIAKSLAIECFGSVEEALNKVVSVRNEECIITSVFDDFPKNCHLQFKLIQSIENMEDKRPWNSQSFCTYIKTITNNVNLDDLSFKLTKTAYTYIFDQIDGANAKTWADLRNSDENYIYFPAEPLKDAHFSNHRFDLAQTSNKTYVYGAIILAILILLISSINYINLSVADLSTRYKEIGIHKTAGAYKHQIAIRFLNESLLFWFVGFFLAVMLYYLTLVPLAGYLDLELNLSTPMFIKIVILSFTTAILFNLATNIFPISAIANKRILNLIHEDKSGKFFSVKSSLILVQFVLSGLIILSSLIVQKQINYIVTKDRGYNTENILTVTLFDIEPEKRKTFIEELYSHTSIINVSTSDAYMGQDPSMGGAFFETSEDENFFHTSTFPVDYEFQNTFHFNMLEGRFFQRDRRSDFDAAIINEAARREYKNAGSLIGKKLLFNGNIYNIIGIAEDFNFRSLHHKLLPLVLTLRENCGNIFIKVHAGQIPEAIKLLQNKWTEFDIPGPLNYTFHDEVLADHYNRDQQAKKLLLVLSIISITIACIGLYAISYFIIIKRTKEIGIRKVNGARISNVVLMLNISFAKWVIAAFAIATPIAWYMMNKWLENFAYKTELNWWVFALAEGLVLGVAILTLIWQSWRAAARNPVEALRYE